MATGATSRAMPHFFFSKKLSTLMAKLQAKRQSKSSKSRDEKSSKKQGKKKNTSKPSKNQVKTNTLRNTSGGSGNFVKMQDIRNKILALRDLLDLSPCIGSASVNELLVWTLKDLQRLHPNIKANISMSKLETALSHQILQCFCGFLKSIGDAWTEDIKWRAKIKYDENKDLNQEDLERVAVELLDRITELARERMYDTVDDVQPKDSSPQYHAYRKALSETSESNSESDKTSFSSSPCTPTSVLPRTSFSRNNASYSPPRLLPLRVQAVERLNPIDLKRLSFHMVSQMASQDPNYFLQRKEIQMDQKLDVDIKNVGDDREVRSGDAYLTFQMEEDMMDIKMTISLKPKAGKNCATDTFVKPAQGIVDVDVVPPPPSLPKVRSRLDLLSPDTRVSTTTSPAPEVQESVQGSVVSMGHSPLPLVLESDQNVQPESSETVLTCSQDMLVNVKTEDLPQSDPAEQTAESTISEVAPSPPSVTSNNEIALPTPPPPPFVAKHSAPLPSPPPPFVAKDTIPPPPPPPPFVAKHTAPAPPPSPPTVAKDTTPVPPPSPPTVAKDTAPVPPPSLPTVAKDTTPAPPPPPPCVAKGTTPPPPPPSLAKDITPASPPPPPSVAKATTPPPPPPTVAKSTTPPPPPPIVAANNTALPPPPPPPGTSKGGVPAPPPPMLKGGGPAPPPGLAATGARQLQAKKCITKLKRSSQMGALYRVLKGKVEGSTELKSSRKGKVGGAAAAPPNGKQGMADALAEMTKRSSYFIQIEEDVKNHSKAIQELKVSIATFQTSDMVELTNFHQNVESLLEKLSDETQVLARFEDFPSKKLEALRMAASLYKKLDNIAMTLQNWKIESPVNQLLVKVENYFTKIRGDLDALERTKDEEAKRFQAQKIHFDFLILVRIKELLVELSSNCMELALKERREACANESGQEIDVKKKSASAKVLWKAFQFAYRVYSFAGGHDERADQLTRELAHEIQIDPIE